MSTDELLAEALRLTRVDRARVAEELLSSDVRLELHPEARAELRSAALWYDERSPGLGDEFFGSTDFGRSSRSP